MLHRSGTLSSSLGCSTVLRGSPLVLLTLLAAVLSVAVLSPARAFGEVLQIGKPFAAAAPLVETVPTVSSIEPTSGSTAGGTAVKIKGTGFLAGSTVTIGAAATSPEVISETEMKATTAAHPAGAVEVVVSDGAGSSSGGPSYTYIAPPPTVSSIEPTSGSTAGGTVVKIKGTGFLAGSTVTIGSAATSPEVISETEMKATTAAHAAGAVEVVVTDSAGSSTGGPKYTYIEEPPPSPPTVERTPPSPAPQTPPPSSPGPSPKGGPTPLPTGPPAPVLARRLDLELVTGQVSIRLPGARRFISLSGARQVPVRTVVETTHGEVSVTAATAHHGTETGEFFDGEFVLTQARNARVLATLTGGDFAACPRTRSSRRSSAAHLVRRLWAEVGGNFATTGKYATGIVNGAQWLTEDLCEGTLILSTRNRVEVTDLVRHRHIEARPGDVYIAKAG